uniref:Ip5 n=1 Tax=Enterobacteria phage RB70 TaxID=36338 RepID=Q38378_BPR70|nr:Ip5 [Enterobacteria phage RB70]
MKTYKEFATETIITESSHGMEVKLGMALAEAERLFSRIKELAAAVAFKGDQTKVKALLALCSDAGEIAKNGSKMKKRLEDLK